MGTIIMIKIGEAIMGHHFESDLVKAHPQLDLSDLSAFQSERNGASELRLLKETLKLSEAEVVAVQNFSKDETKRLDSQCLLMVGSVHGTMQLVPSPMDYWICTSEPMNDIPKRMEKLEEIKEQNPQLNDTDAARRSVYYLGLGAEK